MKIQIITVSDIMLGYGSPQIGLFSESLCNFTKMRGMICQPRIPTRKLLEQSFQNIILETIATNIHPHSFAGRQEYIEKCLKIINRICPSIIIITNYSLFGLIDGLSYKPEKIIHYALEEIPYQHSENKYFYEIKKKIYLEILRRQSQMVDIWIFPEFNRAKNDAYHLYVNYEKIFIFFNLFKIDKSSCLRQRNERILYAGTLDFDTSIAKIIFDKEIASFPIDVYGDLQGSLESRKILSQKINYLEDNVQGKYKLKWYGQIPIELLNQLLQTYAFSLVYWIPNSYERLNAAPNKFFQAILLDVPVITAPHPQPKMLIERYGCGLVMKDWEKKSLITTLKLAESLMLTPQYEEMVENCRSAKFKELSWEVQMNKFTQRFNVKDW